MSTPSTLTRTLGLTLAFASANAAAAEFDYTLRTGITHTDNVGLTQNDPVNQNVLIPGIDFTFQQQGSTLQANATGNVEYRNYLGGAFVNQTVGQLSGQANWTVLPQRLDFTVLDYAGVQPLSTLSSNVPDNQQQTNVLVVGPTLYFRLNQTLRGQAELRYTNSYASKIKEFNSSRGMAALRIFKDLSPTASLSANADTQRVTFDESGSGPAYNRTELYAGYLSQLTYVDINAALGWSRLNFDQAGSESSPLARLNVTWRISPSTSVGLVAARQYSDAAEDLISGSGLNPPGTLALSVPSVSTVSTGEAVISSQVYVERRLEAIYAYSGSLLTLRVAPLYRKFDYVNDPASNQTGRGGDFSVGYRLSPRVALSGFANTESLRYQSIARTDRTSNFGVAMTDQRTAHWSWLISLTRNLRSSTALGASYHANQIYLGVAYRR